jgi:vacuolar-type H+-ATPase subunit E/Vma4
MALDAFVHEIEDRKKREIAQLDKALADKRTSIEQARDSAIKQIQEQYTKEAKIRSEREAAKIVEEARLEAKKVLFEAINSNLDSALNGIKQELRAFTQKPQYKKALQTMAEYAKKKLGPTVVVHCRQEDSALFKDSGMTIGTPIQTIGGIIVEDKAGTRELDLTFEELLRTHEDEVKGALLEGMAR